MVTDAQVEAACRCFYDMKFGAGSWPNTSKHSITEWRKRMRAALEAAEKAAAWQEARVTSADFVSDDTRDEDDERPEGCYVTVRLPLNTEIRAGIARVILPTPPEAP